PLSSSFLPPAPRPPPTSPLSLHDALPISVTHSAPSRPGGGRVLFRRSYCLDAVLLDAGGRHAFVQPQLKSLGLQCQALTGSQLIDRKSTRLNSSHVSISYAVFCLKKKKKQ